MKFASSLDAAALVLESGGSTASAERALNGFLKLLGGASCRAVWRLDCIFLDVVENGQRSTLIRPVGLIGANLARAAEVETLGERAASGGLRIEEIGSEIERVTKIRPPFGRWTTAFGAAAAGASFSQLAGGDPGAILVCAVAAGIGQLGRGQFQAWGMKRASVTFLAALISELIGVGGLRLGVSQTTPATLVGSLIYMVPGLLLINGFFDLTSERTLFVGTQKVLLATFLFLLLAFAVAIAEALL